MSFSGSAMLTYLESIQRNEITHRKIDDDDNDKDLFSVIMHNNCRGYRHYRNVTITIKQL